MEEKLDEKNVQIAQVVPNGGYSILSDADLKALIAQIEPATTEGDAASGSAADAPAAPPAAAAAAPDVQ